MWYPCNISNSSIKAAILILLVLSVNENEKLSKINKSGEKNYFSFKWSHIWNPEFGPYDFGFPIKCDIFPQVFQKAYTGGKGKWLGGQCDPSIGESPPSFDLKNILFVSAYKSLLLFWYKMNILVGYWWSGKLWIITRNNSSFSREN